MFVAVAWGAKKPGFRLSEPPCGVSCSCCMIRSFDLRRLRGALFDDQPASKHAHRAGEAEFASLFR